MSVKTWLTQCAIDKEATGDIPVSDKREFIFGWAGGRRWRDVVE